MCVLNSCWVVLMMCLWMVGWVVLGLFMDGVIVVVFFSLSFVFWMIVLISLVDCLKGS